METSILFFFFVSLLVFWETSQKHSILTMCWWNMLSSKLIILNLGMEKSKYLWKPIPLCKHRRLTASQDLEIICVDLDATISNEYQTSLKYCQKYILS